MDLDQLIDQAAAIVPALPRGRRGKPSLPPAYERDITPEDVPAILASKAPHVPPLQKLRQTHHLAARCIAEGRSNAATAAITGYTPARISQFKADPAFADLVSHYKKEVDAKYLNVHERLSSLGVAITEEIQDRLLETPENFTNEELRRWAETLFTHSIGKNVNVRSQSAVLHLINQVKAESQDSAEVKMLECNS